ncbi:Radical SAM domain protein [Dissulfuribacter thermophilus]|uniref:Radical SAM domain protein n=1 Tax=Dissulfuribacter thermophilus TaxID=1156395 RepID=A0A1B9F2W4_9BACT|nr:radical SAM protein [Dissulfuribacter thermophilus]OCC14155.1 Radical SAM domain protein [Dissulfuribacter thermophilus]
MKIVLINPPIRTRDKPRHIPHGLAIIANIIRKRFRDLTIHFIDWNAHRFTENELVSLLRSLEFDLVITGGLIPVYNRLIRLSNIIKAINPRAIILAGGSAAMSVPELLLQHSNVDIVCNGEGEHTVVELVELLKDDIEADLSNVKGITFKARDGRLVKTASRPLIQDLDIESDMPAYDLLPMEIYLKNHIIGFGRDIDFISSRGCPFHCTFCYQPWGRRFRGHSVEFIKDVIMYLKRKYGVQFVSFQDDEFMAIKARLFEFCETRNRHFPDIRWSCTGRANLVDEEIIKTVRESGCCSVSYGFESGSPRMLKSMRKAITIEQMERAVQLNRKYGLPVPVSFILGMPGEDAESCKETVEFCKRNNLHLRSLMFATPYPGTELFEFALETGRITRKGLHDFVMKLGDARDFVINLTDSFSDEELKNKWHEMVEEVDKHYEPLSQEEMEKRIRALYGDLAEEYFQLSPEDRVHRAQHGAIDLF